MIDHTTEDYTYEIVEETITEERKNESSVIFKHEAERGFYDQILFQTMLETLLEGFSFEQDHLMQAKEQELQNHKEKKRRIKELADKGESYRDELNGRFNREKPVLDQNYS